MYIQYIYIYIWTCMWREREREIVNENKTIRCKKTNTVFVRESVNEQVLGIGSLSAEGVETTQAGTELAQPWRSNPGVLHLEMP